MVGKMAKKATHNRPPDGLMAIIDSPQLWIGSARQFKRLEELNRPFIEKEAASRDFTSESYVHFKDRPVPLDGFDTFLMGVAIENLLKGVLRANGWSFKEVVNMGHKLATLYKTCCKLCGLTVSDDERKALKKLEQFVIWVGKYNLPTENLDNIVKKCGLLAIGSRDGPTITLEVSESERKSIYAVYERFLHDLTMGYTSFNFPK
jgi:hypothetical protein